MARKVLLITIGGSCQPVIKSINQNKPEFIYFICSDDIGKSKGSYTTVDGVGKVCGGSPGRNEHPDQENIVKQTEIEFDYEIKKITHPDNLNNCFDLCNETLTQCKDKFPSHSIIIDYTGGTKSMSASLVLAASGFQDITISLVAGFRSDLTKTIDGTEQISLSRVNNAYLENYFRKADLLLGNFDYYGTQKIIQNLVSEYPDLPLSYKSKVEIYTFASKAFDCWDKFEHIKAFELLSKSPLKEMFPTYCNSLRVLITAKSFLDSTIDLQKVGINSTLPVTNYEIVYDLIQNMRRKYEIGAYDDAVGRIYRSLELFIQIYLKNNFNIITSDINIETIPNSTFKDNLIKSSKNRYQTALLDSYNLLGIISPQDDVFQKFETVKNHLLKVLEIRNHSILAHGFIPIGLKKFQEFEKVAIRDFLYPLIIQKLTNRLFSLEQLPNNFIPPCS